MTKPTEYIQKLGDVSAGRDVVSQIGEIENHHHNNYHGLFSGIVSEDWRINVAVVATLATTSYGLYSICRTKSEEEVLLNRIKKNDPTLKNIKWPTQLNNIIFKQLCRALSTNTHAMSLNLNNMGTHLDIEPLFSLFESNTTLIELNLSGVLMDDDNAKKMGELLQKNQTLQRLVLQDTGIKNSGVQAICKGLEENRSLQLFNFSYNYIDKIGTEYICNMLEKNKTLTIFVLKQNEYDYSTILYFKRIMEKNCPVDLYLDYEGIDEVRPGEAEEIINCVNQNCDNITRLHDAIKNNDLNLTKRYIEEQSVSLISTVGQGRNTPLHLAVINRNVEITSFLLNTMQERKIPFHLKNANGQTAVDLVKDCQEILSLFNTLDEYTAKAGKNYCHIM